MVAPPFKAGIETPTINCVAERQLVSDHRQSAPEEIHASLRDAVPQDCHVSGG